MADADRLSDMHIAGAAIKNMQHRRHTGDKKSCSPHAPAGRKRIEHTAKQHLVYHL